MGRLRVTSVGVLTGLMVILGGLQPPRTHAAEQAGPFHENARWGYKLRAPKRWTRRALRLDERWIADKFFPAYALRGRNVQNEMVQHTPDLWVIGFPHERQKERVKTEQVDEHTTRITIRNPYKDYMDFVKRESWASTGSGGWFVERQERIEHHGYEIDVIEIKVEKLVVAPMRIVTWVYLCADVEFAVQIRILEEAYPENKSAIEACLKSFREIPRTEPFPSDDADRPTTSTEEIESLSLEELDAQRAARVEVRIEREMDNLPKGWRAQTSKHFVALTQRDKRSTSYVLNYAESIRTYLDKHFEDIGAAKVPRGVIRVFASSAEEQAYQQGTRGWWTDEVGEITMTFGRDAGILSEFSWLAGRLTDQYFHIKNRNLKNGMPGWLRHGIWGHIQWARPSKRRKMVLAPRPHDVRSILQMIARDEQLPLRELMYVSTSDFEGYGHLAQASSVVFWLLSRGNRGKTKGALATYLAALDDIIQEEDLAFEHAERKRRAAEQAEALAGAEGAAAKTPEELEAEEEAAYRERLSNQDAWGSRLKDKYETIRARALKAAFGHLRDKDWDSLDKKWKKFAGG